MIQDITEAQAKRYLTILFCRAVSLRKVSDNKHGHSYSAIYGFLPVP